MDSKLDLRIKAKNVRKNLDIKAKSKIAVTKIRQSIEYRNAQHILIYYPIKYEINLLDLLNDNKNFYLPKVDGTNLLVCPYSNELILTKYNIFEPCTNSVEPEVLDLIIVPALMADLNNYRLGYGGGFYDRFLAKLQNIKTILPIPKELLIDKLPADSFDIRIDTIISV